MIIKIELIKTNINNVVGKENTGDGNCEKISSCRRGYQFNRSLEQMFWSCIVLF